MKQDLNKYEEAFALLGPDYQSQVPELARLVMVFAALNTDFAANANRQGNTAALRKH